jgi:Cytochrome c554 and c-prime
LLSPVDAWLACAGPRVAAELLDQRHRNQRIDVLVDIYWDTVANASVRPRIDAANPRANWGRLVPGWIEVFRRESFEQGEPLGIGEAISRMRQVAVGTDEVPSSSLAALASGYLSGIEVNLGGTEYLGLERTCSVERIPGRNAWPEAEGVPIVLTSGLDGFLETCGCKSAQLGGLARRKPLYSDARLRQGLILNAGSFLPRRSVADEDSIERLETSTFLTSLVQLDYDVICPSAVDLSSGLQFVLTGIDSADWSTLNLVSANILDEKGEPAFAPTCSLDHPTLGTVLVIGWTGAPDSTVGLTALKHGLGAWELDPSTDRIGSIVQEFGGASDTILVLTQAGPAEVNRIAHELPENSVIISSGQGFWTHEDLCLPARLRQSKGWGGYVLDGIPIAAEPDGKTGVTSYWFNSRVKMFERAVTIALDDSVLEDESINTLIGTRMAAPLDQVVSIQGSLGKGGKYVGAATCSTCHSEHLADWEATSHARAFPTLVAIHRERHPGCVQCHVTGFAMPGGYVESGAPRHLRGVQCEVCHGPGENHSRTADPKLISRAPTRDLCADCHDSKHSDEFAGRWLKAYESIAHPFTETDE